jgi:hypothetical protein
VSRRHAWLALVGAAAGILVGAADAQAQRSRPNLFRGGSVEIDVGGAWQTRVPFGSISAPLTGNQGAPTVDLFDTSTAIEAFPAVEARLGVHVGSVFEIEGAFRYARPELQTRITGDFENAPDLTATEPFSQYAIELNGVIHLNALRFGDGVPFIFGGAGYLRELHNGRELVETGEQIQGGAGVKILFARSPRGFVRSVGIRADARVYARRRGVEIDDDEPVRLHGGAGAALIIGF